MLGDLNSDQIESFLREQITGRLGCYASGEIYVVPITYAYDGVYVYGRTHEGKKVKMMRENPEVCMEVDVMENFANWKSVIIWGKFEELKGNEALEAMYFFGSRLKPFVVSETAHSNEGISDIHKTHSSSGKSITFRIKVRKKTGRFERR